MELNDFDKNKVDTILYGIGVNHTNRIGRFIQSNKKFTDKEFWYGFSNAYSGTDNLFNWKEDIKRLLSENKDRPFKEYFMNVDERTFFEKLPNKITVYRGMTVAEFESKDFGISWSLSKDIAEFFANRYLRNTFTGKMLKMVHSQEVDKNCLLGYLNEREEQEVVLLYPYN